VQWWPATWDATHFTWRLDSPQRLPVAEGALYSAVALEGRRLYFGVGTRIVSLENGKTRVLYDGPEDAPRPQPSPDGRKLVVTSRFGAVAHVLDGETGAPIASLPVELGARADWNGDGSRLALASNQSLRLMDGTSLQPLWQQEFDARGGGVRFSPDGRWLAVSTNVRETSILRAENGALLIRLRHPQPEPITDYTFSPDGSQLAVVCPTHLIQLWDLRALSDELRELGLGWDGPAFPPAPAPTPLHLEVR